MAVGGLAGWHSLGGGSQTSGAAMAIFLLCDKAKKTLAFTLSQYSPPHANDLTNSPF